MNESNEIINEDRTYRCPECKEELNGLSYTVDSYENGSVDLMTRRITSIVIDPITKKKKKIITEKVDTCNFDSNDNNWNGDPSYECSDCGAALSLRNIIIEKSVEEVNEKEIKEPNNAIES